MKIISQGKKQPWSGKVMRCEDCGCEFKLYSSDSKNIRISNGGDETHGAHTRYSFDCPNCKTSLAIIKGRGLFKYGVRFITESKVIESQKSSQKFRS